MKRSAIAFALALAGCASPLVVTHPMTRDRFEAIMEQARQNDEATRGVAFQPRKRL